MRSTKKLRPRWLVRRVTGFGRQHVEDPVLLNLRYYDDFDSTSGSEDGAMVDS